MDFFTFKITAHLTNSIGVQWMIMTIDDNQDAHEYILLDKTKNLRWIRALQKFHCSRFQRQIWIQKPLKSRKKKLGLKFLFYLGEDHLATTIIIFDYSKVNDNPFCLAYRAKLYELGYRLIELLSEVKYI